MRSLHPVYRYPYRLRKSVVRGAMVLTVDLQRVRLVLAVYFHLLAVRSTGAVSGWYTLSRVQVGRMSSSVLVWTVVLLSLIHI